MILFWFPVALQRLEGAVERALLQQFYWWWVQVKEREGSVPSRLAGGGKEDLNPAGVLGIALQQQGLDLMFLRCSNCITKGGRSHPLPQSCLPHTRGVLLICPQAEFKGFCYWKPRCQECPGCAHPVLTPAHPRAQMTGHGLSWNWTSSHASQPCCCR